MNNDGSSLYSEYLDEWIEQKKKKIKPASYATYKTLIEYQIKPTLGKFDVEDISENVLQDCIMNWNMHGNLQTGEGLAAKTIKDLTVLVKSTVRQYRKKAGLPPIDFSEVGMPDDDNSFVEPFSSYDSQKIIKNIFLNIGKKQLLLSIALGLLAGMRIGEICALRWKDVNLNGKIKTIKIENTRQRLFLPDREKGNTSVVVEDSPKTKAAIRQIPVSNTLALLLSVVRPEDSECGEKYVLTNSSNGIEPRSVRSFYSRFLKSIGIPFRKFHNLRHTFATKWIACGLDVKSLSEILGHRSVQLTMNLYCHPSIEDKNHWMEKFDSQLM